LASGSEKTLLHLPCQTGKPGRRRRRRGVPKKPTVSLWGKKFQIDE